LNSINTHYFLSSDRVGFRWWQPDDLPMAMELWGNPEVTRLFNKEPLTQEQVTQRLEQEIESAQRHHVQYWPIFRLDDNTHIGCAGLRRYAQDMLELGVHLKPKYWGDGLATETGRRIIQHAFDNRLAKTLFAGHHPDNKASRNALLKLGFLGTAAQFYEPTGLFHPSYLLHRITPPCKTRPATPSDARALAIVHCHSIRETFGGVLDDYVRARPLDYCEQGWERRFADNECTTLALVRCEQIVGFASVAPSPDDDVKDTAGELDRIYIHPSVWGNGYGNVLVQWCEETLDALGFKIIKLWVFEVNARARRFYEKHGYKPDGCSKQDFDTRLLRYSKYV
jgi:RimJ/RimL family protein N-acetyltransferase